MDPRKKTVKVSVVNTWNFKDLHVPKRKNDCTNKIFTLDRPWRARGESRGIAVLSLTLALSGGGWSPPHLGRFTHRRKTWYPLCRRLDGPVWLGVENLASTRILFLDCPTHSASLYWMFSAGPGLYYIVSNKHNELSPTIHTGEWCVHQFHNMAHGTKD
jgi:hypothetical protein